MSVSPPLSITAAASVPGQRWQYLQHTASAALFLLPALLLSTPLNLLPFGLLLAASSLLGFDYLCRARVQAGGPGRWLAALAVAVLALGALSVWSAGLPLRDLDNPSRFLVMPWVLLWVCAFRPKMPALWWGAWFGLLATLAVAGFQLANGWKRADAWTNAIVLADVALVLMIVLVFCRPPARWAWIAVGLGVGGLVILCTGSRGVWPALFALLVAMVFSIQRGRSHVRLAALIGLLLVAATLVLSVPQLREHTRLDELRSDVQRIERGDVDSSAGARLERWQVAWGAFARQPWRGVGIGHFDRAMQQLPDCRQPVQEERCHLGHAHNDLAEWAATLGIPGLLLLLGIYGLPLAMFVCLHRRSGEGGFHGPAAAGIMLVVAYALCGLTQSMFAHQITTGTYAVLVGALAGLSLAGAAGRRRGMAAQG